MTVSAASAPGVWPTTRAVCAADPPPLRYALAASEHGPLARVAVPQTTRFLVHEGASLSGVLELRHHGHATKWAPGLAHADRPAPGVALAVAVAVNALHECTLRGLPVPSVSVSLPFPVPTALTAIGDLHGQLTGVPIVLEPVVPSAASGPPGLVFVISGGKESLYALEQAAKDGRSEGAPAVYLMGGAELNWRSELVQVERYAEAFGLDLHIFELTIYSSSSKCILRYGNRAAWREILTIGLARAFGDDIRTGINRDAIAELDPVAVPSDARGPLAKHLSQLIPTLAALERGISARISTVPGEFEVYAAVRDHPLFDPAGSCMAPTCRPEWMCSKCRGFEVYDSLLAGDRLTAEQVAFVRSDLYIGDAAVLGSLDGAL